MSVLMACELFSQGCVKCWQKCGTQLVRPEALKGCANAHMPSELVLPCGQALGF